MARPTRRIPRASRASHQRAVRRNTERMHEGLCGPVTITLMTDDDYLTHFGKPRSHFQPTAEPPTGGEDE
jgi:hypothetical protein